MTRSAADAAAVLGVIAGADPNDPTARQEPVPNYLAELLRGIRGVRIGVDRAFNTTGVDKDMVKVVDDAIAVLSGLGGDIRESKFPSPDRVVKDWLPLCAVETAVAHEATFPKHADQYGPGLRGVIEMGRGLSGLDLTKILIARAAFGGEVAAFFQDVDLLVIPAQYAASPTTATMATLGEDPKALEMLLRFTSPFDVTGSPTITLPGGFTTKGLPVAFQPWRAPWRRTFSCARDTPSNSRRTGTSASRPVSTKNQDSAMGYNRWFSQSIMNRRRSAAGKTGKTHSSPRNSRPNSISRSGPIRSPCCTVNPDRIVADSAMPSAAASRPRRQAQRKTRLPFANLQNGRIIIKEVARRCAGRPYREMLPRREGRGGQEGVGRGSEKGIPAIRRHQIVKHLPFCPESWSPYRPIGVSSGVSAGITIAHPICHVAIGRSKMTIKLWTADWDSRFHTFCCASWGQAAGQDWAAGRPIGPDSAGTLPKVRGTQLAVEEINKAGGVLGRQLKLIAYDTQSDNTRFQEFARRLPNRTRST